MNLTDISLTKAKVIAAGLALLILVLGAGAAGAAINGWRLTAGHAAELAARDKRISDLSLTATVLRGDIQLQNAAVDQLKRLSIEADQRRQAAEALAAAAVKRSAARDQVLVDSTATDCSSMLRETWGKW